MNLRVILFSLILAITLLLLMQKSFRNKIYYGFKEINEHRQLLIVLIAILATLLIFIYPHFNKKIKDFRKNI